MTIARLPAWRRCTPLGESLGPHDDHEIAGRRHGRGEFAVGAAGRTRLVAGARADHDRRARQRRARRVANHAGERLVTCSIGLLRLDRRRLAAVCDSRTHEPEDERCDHHAICKTVQPGIIPLRLRSLPFADSRDNGTTRTKLSLAERASSLDVRPPVTGLIRCRHVRSLRSRIRTLGFCMWVHPTFKPTVTDERRSYQRRPQLVPDINAARSVLGLR